MVHKTLSSEFKSVSELKKLLAADYKIEKIDPPVFASDADVNIVTVTSVCPNGKTQTIRAYREEAQSGSVEIIIITRFVNLCML